MVAKGYEMLSDPWDLPLADSHSESLEPISGIDLRALAEPQLLLPPAGFPHESKYWMKADALMNMTIRQLKSLAKERQLHRYGSLTKTELIEALLLA